MRTIIIDTNAFIAIGEFHLDIFTAVEQACNFNYTIATLQGTIDELQKIQKEQKGKHKRHAKLALSIIKQKNIKILPRTGHVDDVLVELSKKNKLILTQDIALKRRLQKPYLTIRQKKKIQIVT